MVRVLDTNVLLDRSIYEVIKSFGGCDIIIPMAVVQELDHFKKYEDNRGKNAREAIRYMDTLRKHGKIQDGVKTEYGSTLRIEVNHSNVELPSGLDRDLPDNRILMVAKGLIESGVEDVILVTQDICERVIADTLNIPCEDYTVDDVDINEIYTGWTHIELDDREVQNMCKHYKDGMVEPRGETVPNQCFYMTDSSGNVLLGRYDISMDAIVPLRLSNKAWGIKPINPEQAFLMELLLNDDIKLVTALGRAGTGKTLLSLAAGLQKTINDDLYKKVIVSRAIIPIGNDIGFLPGDKEEKLTPWMGAIFDNLEYLTDGQSSKYGKKTDPIERIEDLMNTGKIELEALTYVRGRSIPNQWIIIDEGQNLTKSEMKTIISRAGEGTKIIITGDIEQIDNHRLTSSSNGLVHVINSFKGHDIYGHITLTKTERSELSELAVKLL